MAVEPENPIDLKQLIGLRRVVIEDLEIFDPDQRLRFSGLEFLASQVDRWESAAISTSYASSSPENAISVIHQLAQLADDEGASELETLSEPQLLHAPASLLDEPRFRSWSRSPRVAAIMTPPVQLFQAAQDIVRSLPDTELGTTLTAMASLPTCVAYCEQRQNPPGCLSECLGRSQ